MSTSDVSSPQRPSRAGLCDTCAHQQLVRNTRGSTFSLCRRSRDDPDYPRYPRIPVLECPGHEPPAVAGDGG
jgi:hypothetical protein